MNIHLMNVAVDLIEQRLTPVANIITKNQHITAMRDGFSLAMPFVIVGSLMVPMLFPPFAISSTSRFGSFYLLLRPMLLPTFELTLGLVALIVAFGASASLAKQYHIPWLWGIRDTLTITRLTSGLKKSAAPGWMLSLLATI
ncbi:hypothetical protein M5T48_12640 [Klebsiella aerogenes]|nr:hypothetical protein [Klebsiella aerogenes]UWA53234.1 hypothetical protein M5T48_12640 [Klebsiella aerogenes]